MNIKTTSRLTFSVKKYIHKTWDSIFEWTALLLTVSGNMALTLPSQAAFTDTGTATVRATNGSSGTATGTVYRTTVDGSDGRGFWALSSGTIWAAGVTISTTGSDAYGIVAGDGAFIEVRGLKVQTEQAPGINAWDGGTLNVFGVVIDAHGNTGVAASSAGVIDLHDGAVIKLTGDGTHTSGRAISASGTGSIVRGTAMTIDTYGTYGEAGDTGVVGAKAEWGGLVDLGVNTRITTHRLSDTGQGANAIFSQGEDSLVQGRAVTVVATGYVVSAADGGQVRLTDGDLTGRGGIHAGNSVDTALTAAVILTGGALTATDSDLIYVGGNEHGSFGNTQPVNAVITIRDAALVNTGSGELVSNNSVGGHLEVLLDAVAATEAGGLAVSATNGGTTIVTVNAGSGLNGDVTNSGSGALTVNLNNSALTGDVTNAGDGTLTVILDHNTVGTGGFNGGNLITGSDSAWTFNQDSHGNYGENHGVWNIGNYEVIFDNLDHTGTVNISVNTDTGAGGSLTITGTADGAGTIHINATGNGQADPNQVLPGLVSGDGTDTWQWDPIDWGIDTIIKDGDHFVKAGTSPAGAVFNSAIAIQQAMWFAQQNSLLKRMGDLRYGARASRPLADKDVRVPYNSLIENIWLRSYGQQLNIGSQVAGQAYEQLIYGVDLGTDHKFTISADSNLYLGLYAGYGHSDIDYRTPGADGELNSYYGGLYATWLHSSGFYIDATVKAASVDNDLKAPYGNNQLTASYSDVNLGGSLELGKKFTFTDDWFIEPQFQVNYLHILAENYTAGPMSISAQDLDALQFRIGSLFGRTINLTNSGALQPYVKISGVETISSGGTLRNGYQHIRANTDGARAELGAGLIWQLDTNNQLHLDYEASFGDKYDKPWGLTAGYRHQF
ncbi:MAG: autotransporter outer membrane beta-barrel domain-containing protein [Verrucomicrobiales bacterium]|jgi:outer membrane autotransporter protein|nr:autotransporter outer membrane beta-barrel domain-containing protein [Verrucomicrobiales bacterium]